MVDWGRRKWKGNVINELHFIWNGLAHFICDKIAKLSPLLWWYEVVHHIATRWYEMVRVAPMVVRAPDAPKRTKLSAAERGAGGVASEKGRGTEKLSALLAPFSLIN